MLFSEVLQSHLKLGARFGLLPDRVKRMVPCDFMLYIQEQAKERERIEDAEWQRYADLKATILTASMKTKKRFKYKEFMPRKISNKKKTPSDLLRTIKAINLALGGKEVKHE